MVIFLTRFTGPSISDKAEEIEKKGISIIDLTLNGSIKKILLTPSYLLYFYIFAVIFAIKQ